MLQSDFFDNETEALIDLNVIYGAGKHITDKCLIIFSKCDWSNKGTRGKKKR